MVVMTERASRPVRRPRLTHCANLGYMTKERAEEIWTERVVRLVRECSKQGWDSYGADPVSKEAGTTVGLLLDSLWIGPTSHGGMAITFAHEAISIEFDKHGKFASICCDAESIKDFVGDTIWSPLT